MSALIQGLRLVIKWLLYKKIQFRNKHDQLLTFSFFLSALVSILPEIISETDPREGLKQLVAIFAGILVMALLSNI